MKSEILAAIVVVLLAACSDSKETESDCAECMGIDMTNAQSLWENVAAMQVLVIEDSIDTFFGVVSAMEIINDTVYIHDLMKRPGLYVYDGEGRFLYACDKRGQGPDEFVGLGAFAVGSNGVTLLDHYTGRLIHLDKSGHFIRQEPAEHGALNFVLTSDGVWYDRGNAAYGACKDKLVFVPNKGERKAVLPIPKEIENVTFASVRSLVKAQGDTVYYLPPVEPVVYKCYGGKAEKMYVFDFKDSWPEFNNFGRNDDLLGQMRRIVDAGMVYQLKILGEKNLLCLVFHCGDKVYADLIDTNNNESRLYYLTREEVDELGEPVCINNGRLVFGTEDNLVFIMLK